MKLEKTKAGGGAPNELSFLPDDYLERKARRRANALCAGLSVVVMGAIAAAFLLTERSMRDVEARAAAVDGRFADAARSIEQVNRMKAQQQKIVHHAELAASLVERVPRSNLLAEFTNALPEGTSLLDLVLESRVRLAPTPQQTERARRRQQQEQAAPPAGPPQAQPVQYDVFLKLTGIADTDKQVGDFITALSRCMANDVKLMQEVNLVISETFKRDDKTLRRFQIEMMLNPAAEVKEVPRKADTATAAVEVVE